MTDRDLNGLDSRIDTRGFFERILAERDRTDAERGKRLDERFTAQERAVELALAANTALVNAAFASAKEATEKALTAQQGVNATQNEFRGSLNDIVAGTMPRSEIEGVIRSARAEASAADERNSERIEVLSKEFAELRSRIDVGPPGLSALQQGSLSAQAVADAKVKTRTFVLGLVAAIGTVVGIIGVLAALSK